MLQISLQVDNVVKLRFQMVDYHARFRNKAS